MARALYLVRHGRAEPSGETGDAMRRLLPEGVAELEAAAVGLRELGVQPARIVTSPLLRTRQTADILRRELAPKAPLLELVELASGADAVPMTVALAAQLERASPLLAVGHMPDLSDLLKHLTGVAHGFDPGSVARLLVPDELEARGAELLWLHSPAQLRR